MENKLKPPGAIRQSARNGRGWPFVCGDAATLRRLFGLFLLLALAAAPSLARDDSEAVAADEAIVELEVDEASLERISAEVIAAVSEQTGVSLEGLAMRVVKRSELRAVLKAELEPQFAAMFADPEEAATQLQQTVMMYSRSLLGKYATGADEVLICERNFNAMAHALKQPRLTSHAVLRVVLVHEAVHAVDERAHHFSKTLNSLRSRDEITAFSAVMEGHAQYVARQVTGSMGWSSDFEFFTDMIDESPATGEAALDYMAGVQVASIATAYYDGESFIAYLAEHGGPDAIARAFREPPAEAILIEEPGWYLDPATRPALVHDFEPVLVAFSEARDAEGDWNNRVMALTSAQVDAAFSILPKAEVAPIVKKIRQSLVLVQMASDAPMGTVMIAAGLFEATSSEDARRLLELEELLMRKKDEVMNSGQVKIKDAQYLNVTRGPITGMLSSKTIEAGNQELFAQTVVLRRDFVVLEVSFVGHLWDEDEVLGLGVDLLQAAHLSRRPVEERAVEEDE